MTGTRRRVGVVPSEELSNNIPLSPSESGGGRGSSPIGEQLKLIESTKATERARGVQQLAEILDEDTLRKGSALASSLSESTWQQVITWTARVLIKEAQTFINRHSEEWPSQMSATADRLSSRIQTQYSVHVRHIWIAAMPHLSPKLARFLTKHITESLVEEPCLVQVYGLDYYKVLCVWAAHEPHVLDCKDTRAEAIVNLCIRNLSHFGSAGNAIPDTQASAESSATVQGTSPGDSECATVLQAVMAVASPARTFHLSGHVLEFCAEYCRFYTRENSCFSAIIETATGIMLKAADTLVSDRSTQMRERIGAILTCCLQLWSTRSVQFKRTLLHCIRIVTRIMITISRSGEGAGESDSDLRPVLELALKHLTLGQWSKFKFMSLPRSILTIWPMLHDFKANEFSDKPHPLPLERFIHLHSVVDPMQFAFFDTVAYLVAYLTATHNQLPKDSGVATHRKKRTRTAPTALARMLTDMGSDDSPANSCGAAQTIWYVVTVYAEVLGESKCTEALQEIHQFIVNSDMSHRADLAEWVLGSYRSLTRLGITSISSGDKPALLTNSIWPHSIAGVEFALAGAAGLVFDLLHHCSVSATEMHDLCRQAANALETRLRRPCEDFDTLQLLLLVVQYMRSDPKVVLDDRVAQLCAKLATRMCQFSGKSQLPADLFAIVMSRALGFTHLDISVWVNNVPIADSVWNYEARFLQALQVLEAFVDTPRDSTYIPIQTQIADGFSERLVALAIDVRHPQLLWQTLTFVSPWTLGYSRIASLDVILSQLLKTMLDSNEPALLCSLAQGSVSGASVSGRNCLESQLSATAETSRRMMQMQIDPVDNRDYRGLLKSRMLFTASGLTHAPWRPAVDVLLALGTHCSGLASEIVPLLSGVIDNLDGLHFLVSCELIMHTISQCTQSTQRSALLEKLKIRALSFLDLHGFSRHMPTLFSVLHIIAHFASKPWTNGDDADEDMPKFVAWLAEDAYRGSIDPLVDAQFMQMIIGPWGRQGDQQLCHALSILELSPIEYLVRQAQTSYSFQIRVAAERQLAMFGLRLPYIASDGSIDYPDAPETSADEVLVLMTRDMGLAMLIFCSKASIPGAISILAMQAVSDSACPPFIRTLCYRLLYGASVLLGYSTTEQMIEGCSSDILYVESEMHKALAELAPGTPSTLAIEASREHMVRGELAEASALLTKLAVVPDDKMCELYAHVLVISTSNSDLYANIYGTVLKPYFSEARMLQLVRDTPEKVILQLILLYLPYPSAVDSMEEILALSTRSEEQSSLSRLFIEQLKSLSDSVLVRSSHWGRRYRADSIHKAINSVMQISGHASIDIFLTSPRVAWIIINLHSRIQAVRSADQRQQLMYSACLLLSLSTPYVLDSPLVLSAIHRLLTFVWTSDNGQASLQAGLAFGIVIGSCSGATTSELFATQGTSLVGAITGRVPELASERGALTCIDALSCLLKSISQMFHTQSQPFLLPELLVGSTLEGIYDWSQLPSIVIPVSNIWKMDDRLRLAHIAEQAASLLLKLEAEDSYLVTCAEFLVASTERLLCLALPPKPLGDNCQESAVGPMPDGPVQIDLARDVVKVLTNVRRKVYQYLCNASGADCRQHKGATAMLLRTTSLLYMLDRSPADSLGIFDLSKDMPARDIVLPLLVSRVMKNSTSQSAITAAIDLVVDLSKLGQFDETDSSMRQGGQDWRIPYEMTQMPAVTRYDSLSLPIWIQQKQTQALDNDFLELLCLGSQTADRALSELVCALASYHECEKFRVAIPLIYYEPYAARFLLPYILFEILPVAKADTRKEVAAFLLDFAHNWRESAPAVVRDMINGIMRVRMLDRECYSDIREFFGHLPLALFEVADLAFKLNMPETAAFLLECDLTCTGAERLTAIDNITGDARVLLRSVYRSLGNQPAAQLLNSVESIEDVLRKCQDSADWRTLLLYQEAVPNYSKSASAGGEFEIGDTLVNLGLLNAIRSSDPGSWVSRQNPAAATVATRDSNTHSDSSNATFAASWRLAKWDVPSIPLSQVDGFPSTNSALLAPVAERSEESLYSMLKFRALGQYKEASLLAQEHMSSSSAIAALTLGTPGGLRESWTYHTVSALLPLISGEVSGNGSCGNHGVNTTTSNDGFLHTSQIASFVLLRCCNSMPIESIEPIYQANLSLHEIVVRDTMALRPNKQSLLSVFNCYKEAVRSACMASRQAQNWQNSMNNIFRLRAISREIGVSDRLLDPELKLWEAETLWEAGSRNLAIELLQSHKNKMASVLQQAKASLAGTTDGSDDNGAILTRLAADSWSQKEIEAATILLSRVILTVGEWSDKQRKERPKVLWDEYFNKSALLLQGIRSPTVWTGRALHALAEFATRQCEELTGTRDDETATAVRKQKSRELAACRQEMTRAANSAEASRLKAILRRLEIQETNDQKELETLLKNIGGFLRLAIWSFVKCLECTNTFDNSIYPLTSLIVTHARSQELQTVLSPDLMDGVPSRKFLPLVHQLCARLSNEEDAFHKSISRVVLRMTVDYPYHTMYHLFALRNANRTSPTSTSNSNAPSSAAPASGRVSRKGSVAGGLDSLHVPESEKMEQRRSEAATQILVGVTSNNSDLKSIVQAIDELCNVYIELAVSPVPEKFRSSKLEGKLIAFSSRLRITRLIKNLPLNIPVLTAIPRTDAPRDYLCVPFISTISEGYSLAGGINLPKITRILGTDGKRYKQLVKGKDDMRQDAVIQQLFHVINNFMRSAGSKASGPSMSVASGLQMRTYQVVPLTKRCGVLQWVDNTMPFGNWFREKEAKYRPGAPGTSQMRNMIHNVHKEKAASMQEKLDVFEKVCLLAPPIFRFFFYENFYHPQSWFEHRETYIRSAAVSSIAGWVLGIGDRHLQNILVDQSTAELVHIDLGIAFDLGKLLPIPELVPFRLTREMVDGMGLLGLSGTFRHHCQAVLEAMRGNSRIIITILNVLKVDPLYMWSLIPLRIDKMNRNVSMYVDEFLGAGNQSSDSGVEQLYSEMANAAAATEMEENKEASRSILHVGQRLNAGISVEGQVSELIQQATDPNLLSRMFEGWSAWY
ncbi:hypothetical protein GGI07_001762 [Coemansia sp. Benny D115]|nr:hypothetical protein GGI07_001762 [Coemansia sp. Benny D115]